MIITHLKNTANLLDINGNCPVFLYDMQQMENYTADNVSSWFVLIPVIQEKFNFDNFADIRMNLPAVFAFINPADRAINQDSKYYDKVFTWLIRERNRFLLNLDQIKDTEQRRLITVRDEEITTRYIAQDTFYDAPCTTIEFNLPITISKYGPICP